MEIPIELFLGFIGFSFFLALFGFLRNPQVPAMLAFGGIFILTISAVTTEITMNNDSDSQTFESYIPYMEQNLGTSPLSMNSVNNIFVGEEVVNSNSALYLKSFDQVTLALTRSNSPTGLATVGVWGTQVAPTASNYLYTLGTIDTATLGTSITVKTFRNTTNAFTILDNMAIGIFYNGASGTNLMNVMTTSSSQFDGTNSQTTRYTSSWTDVTTDVRMNVRLTSVELETTPIEFEFTEFPKTIFILFGAILMLAGGLMVYKE